MTAATDELALKDLLLLRQEEEVEAQFMAASLGALRGEVRARFGVRAGPRSLRPGVTRPFAEQYATAMVVGYLYGAIHAQKLLESQAGGSLIQLAGERFDIPFAEAEDYLRAQVAINRDEFDALKAGLKFRAFTIAKVGREDLIRRIQGLYQEQLAQGHTRAELLQQMDGLLTQAGIGEANPRWLQTHYRNNMMAAYNAGRWAQVEHNSLAEFLMYNSIVDDATTKLCKELDGTVLPKGDKRWQSIHPTNHHGCRAVVVPVSREQAKLRGIKPSQLNLRELKKDPKIAREHQFKAHPAAVLDAVPSAMAQRAADYGQWPDILKFAAKGNRAFLTQRLGDVKKMAVGQHTINHAVKRHPEVKGMVGDAKAALANYDEAWLALTVDTHEGTRQSIRLVKWLDGNQAMTVSVRMAGGAKTFYTESKENLERLVKEHGWVRLH